MVAGASSTAPDVVVSDIRMPPNFQREGIDAAKVRVEAAGGQVTSGPMEVPGGKWIVQCLIRREPTSRSWRQAADTRAGKRRKAC